MCRFWHKTFVGVAVKWKTAETQKEHRSHFWCFPDFDTFARSVFAAPASERAKGVLKRLHGAFPLHYEGISEELSGETCYELRLGQNRA